MTCHIKNATRDDAPALARYLKAMQDEIQEQGEISLAYLTQSVTESFALPVHWFLFADETGAPFGTCHLVSVYNYWRPDKRFYIGGFFIDPRERGKGRVREIYPQLRAWAEANDGYELYAHIHKDNEQSKAAFGGAGLKELPWRLFSDLKLEAL